MPVWQRGKQKSWSHYEAPLNDFQFLECLETCFEHRSRKFLRPINLLPVHPAKIKKKEKEKTAFMDWFVYSGNCQT